MSRTSFEEFVERRLNEQPQPSGSDPTQLRFLVGAGEVMFDILVVAVVDDDANRQMGGLIESAIAGGDPVARVEKDLLLLWTQKKMSGDTTSLGDRPITDDEAKVLLRGYRALIMRYVGIAEANRSATLDAVLTAKAAQGDPLSVALKTMFDTAVEDISLRVKEVIRNEVERAKQLESANTTPRPDSPRAAATPARGGCYVATAVYGSYECPEVRVLRRYRDQRLSSHSLGRAFIRAYYALSPTVVRMVGADKRFSQTVRPLLDLLVARLREKGHSDSPYVDATE